MWPFWRSKPKQKAVAKRASKGSSYLTNNHWAKQLKQRLSIKKRLNETMAEEIETLLLSADVGVKTTQALIQQLLQTSKRKDLNDDELLFERLRQQLLDLLDKHQRPFAIEASRQPTIILVVGVNGVGKTTSIGKLCYYLQQQNHSVLLAAGDTFRAAAAQQLQHWGAHNSAPVISQHAGADSAAVIFDSIEAAKARNSNVVIADTAGRIHSKKHLMRELEKICRVIARNDPSAPHEVLLVLDASTGQNAINQAQQFCNAVKVSGLVLTKLDGSARGGILFALVEQFELPIYFVGTGERVEDWATFDSQLFIESLFSDQ